MVRAAKVVIAIILVAKAAICLLRTATDDRNLAWLRTSVEAPHSHVSFPDQQEHSLLPLKPQNVCQTLACSCGQRDLLLRSDGTARVGRKSRFG